MRYKAYPKFWQWKVAEMKSEENLILNFTGFPSHQVNKT